jgi:hypothetical protein
MAASAASAAAAESSAGLTAALAEQSARLRALPGGSALEQLEYVVPRRRAAGAPTPAVARLRQVIGGGARAQRRRQQLHQLQQQR